MDIDSSILVHLEPHARLHEFFETGSLDHQFVGPREQAGDVVVARAGRYGRSRKSGSCISDHDRRAGENAAALVEYVAGYGARPGLRTQRNRTDQENKSRK